MNIVVAHCPPYSSKQNQAEYRAFGFINEKWQEVASDDYDIMSTLR
jgi:hypothetical protein